MKNDRRDFDSVLRGIRGAEEDVDKVLDAARLDRHERGGFWKGTDFLEFVFELMAVLVVLGAVLFPILTIIFE